MQENKRKWQRGWTPVSQWDHQMLAVQDKLANRHTLRYDLKPSKAMVRHQANDYYEAGRHDGRY